MNFSEAIDLAGHIHVGDKAALISVGRFLPVGEIKPSSPWGCSVLVHGSDKARVVWSLAEFVDLFAVDELVVEERVVGSAGVDERDPLPSPTPRPDAEYRRQPTLF